MEIIGSIINFIVEISFEVGLFIADLLSLKKGKLKEEMSPFKKLILSIIGTFIICLIVLLIVILIIFIFFRT